jgi:putative membrane protein
MPRPMPDDPYARFQREELSLTDELAIDRTVLANERTLLAYIRTALGFLVLGLTFHHFLEQVAYHILGFTFMGFAAVLFTFGIVRFLQVRRSLRIARGRRKSEVPNDE